MSLTSLYYHLKPFIPSRVRLALRRRHVQRVLARCQDVWPIDELAGRTPEGWPGWPDGKSFAFVLTHDVETQRGLDQVKPLAELEMRLGFRSSFNFIPEGPYAVPAELRAWLTERGFEVGVHDLHHDGKLYSSRHQFRLKADRINRYLKEWSASGFRSGFMFSKLDWLHDLNICYDASTFDTDPFEPQPQGAGTIFPFWVARPNAQRSQAPLAAHRSPLTASCPPTTDLRPLTSDHVPRSGYVELPYTLPQDSTLFLILKEQTIDIWKRKLDWIVARNGMALINVHPDYAYLGNSSLPARTFPISLYEEFLGQVSTRYARGYWHALPRDVARYCADLEVRPYVRPSRKIGMVTHSFYESDNRVTRYAEALAARGDRVEVIALRRNGRLPIRENLGGVEVLRIQDRFGKSENSKLSFLWPLLRFLGRSSAIITRRHLRKNYDLLHIHNVPDFMVFAGWFAKLTGARIILDIHDIVPEFYASKFGSSSKSLTVTMLKGVERASAALADHVIIANHLWLEKYAARTGTSGRCTAFINNVNTEVFVPLREEKAKDKLIILFPGGLQWHQGVDIAIRAFARVLEKVPEAEFHIYGDGNARSSLIALSEELGLSERVRFFEPRSVREIARIMAAADLGVVPKRADSFGNEAYSTKIMEFMSVGVPVVISNTKVDRHYFNDSIVRFCESGNPEAFAEGIIEVLANPVRRAEMVARAHQFVSENDWGKRKGDYLALVDGLVGAVPAPPSSSQAPRSLPGDHAVHPVKSPQREEAVANV